MSDKQSKILGWLGTTLAILMYVSYIPQIMGNFQELFLVYLLHLQHFNRNGVIINLNIYDNSIFYYILNFIVKQVPCSNSLSRSIVAE